MEGHNRGRMFGSNTTVRPRRRASASAETNRARSAGARMASVIAREIDDVAVAHGRGEMVGIVGETLGGRLVAPVGEVAFHAFQLDEVEPRRRVGNGADIVRADPALADEPDEVARRRIVADGREIEGLPAGRRKPAEIPGGVQRVAGETPDPPVAVGGSRELYHALAEGRQPPGTIGHGVGNPLSPCALAIQLVLSASGIPALAVRRNRSGRRAGGEPQRGTIRQR